jgi:hypothetical protein
MRTFLWMILALMGLCCRADNAGVTSFVRVLNFHGRCASTYLSPGLCSQRPFIRGEQVRCDDGLAFGVERHSADGRPVSSGTRPA